VSQVDERRRPLRADARRSIASIIDAARDVLATDPSADMRTIADRAGVNRATVYRHFPSRDELLHAVYLEYVERFTVTVEGLDRDAPDAIAELRRVTLDVLTIADHWRPFRYAAPYPEEVTDHRMRMGGVLVPFFASGQAQGAFRSDLDALDLATAWGMPFPFASIRMAEGFWSRERAAEFILALLTPSR
jgi:AcrR family transcriptional regulator